MSIPDYNKTPILAIEKAHQGHALFWRTAEGLRVSPIWGLIPDRHILYLLDKPLIRFSYPRIKGPPQKEERNFH